MRALLLNRYGGAEATTIADVPTPEPGPGEVLVKVVAAGLNPVDFKTRAGQLRAVQRYALPAVMGNELAGTVAARGAGATKFAVGDRVFGRMPKARMGAFAEYAAVPEEVLAASPSTLDDVAAAAIPLAGLTALQALRDELRLAPGDRVFIPGGAGGVGTFAIQLAKWLGAQVVTTASPRGRALVERLGADRVVDYSAGRFEDQVRDMDAAFDLIGGDTLARTFAVVKRGGTVVSVAGLPEPRTARQDLGRGGGLATLFWLISLPLRWRARRHGVRYRYLFMHPSGSELAELARLADTGVLHPVVDCTFPFERIGEALAYLEAGHAKGKVVVTMQPLSR